LKAVLDSDIFISASFTVTGSSGPQANAIENTLSMVSNKAICLTTPDSILPSPIISIIGAEAAQGNIRGNSQISGYLLGA
jgi:hypothetical protein